MEELITWINEELNERGWSQRELARRASISTGQLSMVMNEQRGAGPDFCSAVARAFGVPPVMVFRKAGILPPISSDEELEEALLFHFRDLPSIREKTRFVLALRAWTQD